MTIGPAWDISNPKKPVADWDPDANIAIPIGLATWLVEIGATYGSHQVIAPTPLECVSPGSFEADEAGTVRVRMKKAAAGVFTPGVKYPFTIRVIGADGVTQDDRTLYLKLKDR